MAAATIMSARLQAGVAQRDGIRGSRGRIVIPLRSTFRLILAYASSHLQEARGLAADCAALEQREQPFSMSYAPIDAPSGLSRWTSRIAVFSLLLIVAAAFLHRLFGMPTPVAANLVAVAYAGAAIAVVMAIIASVGVWRYGNPGAARLVVGFVTGAAMLSAPLLLLPLASRYPPVNDVTTDTVNPPEYEALAALRKEGANPANYPGSSFADLQKKFYPDLKPLIVNRAAIETFELTVAALKKLRFDIVSEKPNTEGEVTGGLVEAVDRTLIMGFYDDVAIRVTGNEEEARIDLRSSSRYGVYDFGRNADRMRDIMKEIVLRLEATVPAIGDKPKPSANNKVVKPQKDGDRALRVIRKQQDGARPGSRRERERKEPQP
jgi:uncharacterized protein (DUF1499 family)